MGVSAKDISKEDYANYVNCQTVEFESFESEVPQFGNPVKDRVRHFFTKGEAYEGSRILDAGCGDGLAMLEMQKFGFSNLFGIELNERKVKKARKHGLQVKLGDIHYLDRYYRNKFDVIYCSHVIEHCFDPITVLGHFKKLLADGGSIFLTVPHPDTQNHSAHCGTDILKSSGNLDDFKSVLVEQGFEVISIDHVDAGHNCQELRVILKIKE